MRPHRTCIVCDQSTSTQIATRKCTEAAKERQARCRQGQKNLSVLLTGGSTRWLFAIDCSIIAHSGQAAASGFFNERDTHRLREPKISRRSRGRAQMLLPSSVDPFHPGKFRLGRGRITGEDEW